MIIAGRDYPTPLVVGGVAGVVALVVGQRLLGQSHPADAGAAAAVPGVGQGGDVGQLPPPTDPTAGGSDWWDAGGTGGAAFPPAPINDPGSPIPPTPVGPPIGGPPTGGDVPPTHPPGVVPPPPAPAPRPTTYPAGTVARATFPAGTYRTARVSGSRFLGYGPSFTTGGLSAWAGRPVALANGANSTTWFKLLSGTKAGSWCYRWDPNIRWQPV